MVMLRKEASPLCARQENMPNGLAVAAPAKGREATNNEGTDDKLNDHSKSSNYHISDLSNIEDKYKCSHQHGQARRLVSDIRNEGGQGKTASPYTLAGI
mmetsp:Transcript_1118/g.1587  ORF Transcript_1118/g.1587 Transcript_1118/m.1587 type:complete len:99 (-) Transcript_1118:18-314(-)